MVPRLPDVNLPFPRNDHDKVKQNFETTPFRQNKIFNKETWSNTCNFYSHNSERVSWNSKSTICISLSDLGVLVMPQPSPPCSFVSAIIHGSAESSFSTLCELESLFCCPAWHEGGSDSEGCQVGHIKTVNTSWDLTFSSQWEHPEFISSLSLQVTLREGITASFLRWGKWGLARLSCQGHIASEDANSKPQSPKPG